GPLTAVDDRRRRSPPRGRGDGVPAPGSGRRAARGGGHVLGASVKATFYGTRGSLATPGRATERYGGNTACVLGRGDDGAALVLDAGAGIRAAGGDLPRDLRRVDVLLTHLHMDHIQGLGFFGPLYNPAVEVHI